MKKLTIPAIIIIVLIVGVWYYKKFPTAPTDQTVKTYKNSNIGISFIYPKIISASTTGETAILHHDITYENNGDCDMRGDDKIYPRLTDFKVTFKVSDKNIVETMKK